MTIRVDFYLIEGSTAQACYTVASRIIEKAYQQGHRVYVLCLDEIQSQTIDKLLWTFQDTSFLPHQIRQQTSTSDIPILIGNFTQSLPKENYDILLNLTSSMPQGFNQFTRVIEVVSAEPTQRAQARERFKMYRELGCDLHSHQLR